MMMTPFPSPFPSLLQAFQPFSETFFSVEKAFFLTESFSSLLVKF